MYQNHSEEENIDGIIKEILSVPSITAAIFNRDEKLEEATQVMANMSSKRRIKFINQVVKETATKIGSMYIPIMIIAGCPGTSTRNSTKLHGIVSSYNSCFVLQIRRQAQRRI